MKHIKTFESYRIKKNRDEIIKEAVLQVNDVYKVKTMIDVPQSLINSYVKKVKETTGNDLRKFFGDVDIAEEIVKYINNNNLDSDTIPTNALMGGDEEDQAQAQVQDDTQAQAQVQDDTQAQAQVQDDAQVQAQVQDDAQAQAQVQDDAQAQAQVQDDAQVQAQVQDDAQAQDSVQVEDDEDFEEIDNEDDEDEDDELPL